ncbi:hypothetical protein LNQ03_00545 [Klebsiella pneumoniae subsp. pneumoniae]|nr:hypothetical protein [Klebsiella pneumoniae subsp. pneumoniae]
MNLWLHRRGGSSLPISSAAISGSIYDATQLEIVEAGGVQLVKNRSPGNDNEYGFVTQLIRVLEKFAR